MVRRKPLPKFLLVLMACACGLAIFVGFAIISQIQRNAKLDAQADMFRVAPDLLAEGARSNLFVPGIEATKDITGYFPTYLVGAVSQVFDSPHDCTVGHVAIMVNNIYCRWPTGYVLAANNAMPQFNMLKESNNFNSRGVPLDKDGKPLIYPQPINAGNTSFSDITYSDDTEVDSPVSEKILHSLTGLHLSQINNSGRWYPARPGLGFRTCWADKSSHYVHIACYRG